MLFRNSRKIRPELQNSTQRARAKSGVWAIFGIAALGLGVLVLLFAAPRVARRAPDLPWGVPASPIRPVVVDLWRFTGGFDAAIHELARVRPDLVLMQGAPGDRLLEATGKLGFPADASAFYPAQQVGGPQGSVGNAILSRYPLFETRSIPNRGGSFGVWGVVIIDGVRLYVASAQPPEPQKNAQAVVAAWEKLDHPPMLLGLGASNMTGQAFGLLSSHGLVRTNGSGVTTAPADAPVAPVELMRSRGWQVLWVAGRSDGWLEIELTRAP